MDFAWVVDALRRGIIVTRKAWAGDPPMYLYMMKNPDGKHIIKMHTGTSQDFEWSPTAEQMLTVTDWEEYVDPKTCIQSHCVTGETVKITQKESAEDKEGWIDYARGVVHCGEDTGYMAEQLEMLADIYAEKISQRVVQLLQKS